MIRQISVVPLVKGWAVLADHLAAPITFESGARAEAAARDLADRLSMTGAHCELEIRLRDGRIAARIVSPPRPAAAA